MTKTSCDWIVERLPWWANETLEEGERERVAAHLDDCAACREELAATREAMGLYAAHLPIEALLDLAEGGAGAASEFRMVGGVSRATAEAHLGHCAQCREELALLHESRAATLADPDEAGGTVTAFGPRRAAPPRRRFDFRRLAVAASLLAAVVSAGGWFLTDQAADERQAWLEQEIEVARAEREAATPPAEESPAGASIEELRAAAERAAAERDAAARRVEELQAENAELVAAARSDDARPTIGLAPIDSWNVMRTRGNDPAEVPDFAPPAGTGRFVIHFAVERDRPLRLVVEGSSGERLIELPVVARSGAADPTVVLDLDRLPEGTLRLRLFEGDEMIADNTLHNQR